MTRRGLIATMALLAAGLRTASADEPDALAAARRMEQAVQQAIAKAEPAIACLLVYRGSTPVDADRFNVNGTDAGPKVPEYFGSGVVIHAQGLILTNYHVVRDATRIQVRLPGITERDGVEAEVLAGDSFSDLAVLKIKQPPPRGLTAITMGAGEKLRKGSMVIALGHPYAAGFRDGSPSASSGIVSNLRRRISGTTNELNRKESLTYYATLIQTDARLQLGQSGGAMVDLDGKLVGLTTAQAALTGYDAAGGFALPMDAGVRRIVEVLSRGEEVEMGFLGVTKNPQLWQELARPGVSIDGYIRNSPADSVGLREGDVIVEVNGQPIHEYDDLVLHLSCGLAGRKATLKVRRGQSTITVEPVLAKAPPKDGGKSVARNRPKPVYNLTVDYASTVAADTKTPLPNGVVVREFKESSSEKRPRLNEGELITHVNDKPVRTPTEFYKEANRAAKDGESLKLTVTHPVRTVTLQP